MVTSSINRVGRCWCGRMASVSALEVIINVLLLGTSWLVGICHVDTTTTFVGQIHLTRFASTAGYRSSKWSWTLKWFWNRWVTTSFSIFADRQSKLMGSMRTLFQPKRRCILHRLPSGKYMWDKWMISFPAICVNGWMNLSDWTLYIMV